VNGWTVKLSDTARRDFRRLEPGQKQAAAEILQELEEEGPTHVDAFQMRGMPDTWKVRFHHDRCRMNYQVAKAQRRIIVKRIRLRPVAYEGMKT
jgi:mRNA-degrading endonuclease RelE of RelBE toxin-antitoxin system